MPRQNVYWLLLLIVISWLCYSRADQERRTEYGRLFDRFYKAMKVIDEEYVQETDPEELFQGGMRGLISELDQYSAYYTAEEYEQMQTKLDGEFGGIGVQIGLDPDTKQLTVISPLVGTPAYRAGIEAGDKIVAIDGTSTEGFTLQDAVELLQGSVGEPVTLTVLSPDEESPREVELVRDIVSVESVLGDRHFPDGSWNFLLEGAQDIGYIRVTNFGKKTADELQDALDRLQEKEVQGVVLDLRNNPGGLLSQAVAVCDLFIDKGIIVSTRGRGKEPNEEYSATQAGTYQKLPIVILVNHFSASASEIVSACLQDHKRAIVVGERTWGKGSVQHVRAIGDDAIKITIATYHRPSGENIHRLPGAEESDPWGVQPDPGHEVKLTTEQTRELITYRRDRDVISRSDDALPEKESQQQLPLEVDPQLKHAVEVLRGQTTPMEVTNG